MPSNHPNRYEVSVVSRRRELAALRAEWTGLLERIPDDSPFLTYEWLTTWWDAFAADATMHLVVVHRAGRLVAIAPFLYRTERVAGHSRRVLGLWSNDNTDRTGLLVDVDAPIAVRAIVDHIVERAPSWDVAELVPLERSVPTTSALLDLLHQRGLTHGVTDNLQSPHLEMPGGWDDLVDTLGASFRKSLRRKTRAGDLAGRLSFEIIRDPSGIDTAFDIARDSWQYENGTSIASTDALRSFYSGLARVAHDRGWLQFAFMRLDDEPVAFEFNLVYHGTAYNLKLGYRKSHAGLSPGILLKQHVLRELIDAGIRRYDFLGGDEPYKLHWTSHIRPHCRVTVYRRRPTLVLSHLVRHRVKPFIKRRFPALVERRRRRLRGR